MPIRIAFLAAAALTIAAPVPSFAQTSAVVDHAVAAWSAVRSLSGSFEQTLTNPLTRTKTQSRGEYKQQRPNKLAIRFTEPAGDAIVSDGAYLWVYLPDVSPNQVRRMPAADHAEIPIDLSQFLDRAKERFDITDKGAETVDGHAAHVLGLVPARGSQAVFTRATVWVDDADGLIHQFEVVEQSGLTRRIHLRTLTVNPVLTASDFTFVPPKGTKIIER